MKRFALVFLLAACDRPSPAPPPAPPSAPAPSHPAPAAVPPPAAPPPAAPPSPTPAEAPVKEDDEDLRGEEREADPRSEAVKLKLIVTPAAKGTVHWGRKKLADLQPGHMTLDTERPRNSGPLDLLIRADGFLPHHVRLFTDRDDKLSVHLVRPDQATGLLGYRRPSSP
jgi:hypothetical protein